MRYHLNYMKDNLPMLDCLDTYKEAENYMNELKAEDSIYSALSISEPM